VHYATLVGIQSAVVSCDTTLDGRRIGVDDTVEFQALRAWLVYLYQYLNPKNAFSVCTMLRH
jgi:hypothetical protein